ncbi:hypothetical protein B4098_3188 [Heyndrickxia coagulans]|uniref:Uncharacterized protein n=1 Tax=Heyndrickxia coagulans TaxID=1398 RepID=A0A150K4D6_HEYCO|nr:hypothetical protein B4098_3188 [Heyndrickxia coagulans]
MSCFLFIVRQVSLIFQFILKSDKRKKESRSPFFGSSCFFYSSV